MKVVRLIHKARGDSKDFGVFNTPKGEKFIVDKIWHELEEILTARLRKKEQQVSKHNKEEKEMKEQFVKCLKEICIGDSHIENFVQWIPSERPEPFKDDKCVMRVQIYTSNHLYRITAVEHQDGRTYLGCTSSVRKPRAGEDWTRGNDLPDGEFTRETWESIKNGIISNELVRLESKVEKDNKPLREGVEKGAMKSGPRGPMPRVSPPPQKG